VRRFLYDTAIFVYAVGAEHPYLDSCRAIVERARRGELTGEASIELVQELAHVRMRRGGDRTEALAVARAAAELCQLHDFHRRDLPLVMTLLEHHDDLHVRDAVHAATALNRNIDAILTPDRAFDVIPGLERIDPADVAGVATLAQ